MSRQYPAPYTTTAHKPCGAGVNLVPSSVNDGQMSCLKCRRVVKEERDFVIINTSMTADRLARLDWNEYGIDQPNHHELYPVPSGLVRLMQSFLDRLEYQISVGKLKLAGGPASDGDLF